MIREIEVALAQQHVLAEALHHGPATPRAYPIGRDGAEIGRQRGQRRQQHQLRLAVGQRKAGKGHDDLGRDRHARRLHSHQHQHDRVAGANAQPHENRDEFGHVS